MYRTDMQEKTQRLSREQAMYYTEALCEKTPLVMDGVIGTWEGPRMTAVLVGSADDLEKVAWMGGGISDVEYFLTSENTLEVRSYHHDGTNVWSVRAVSARGDKWLSRQSWNGRISNLLGLRLANTKGHTKIAKVQV